MSTSAQYYTRTAQILHWLMAAIFITAWLIGFYSGNFLSYDVDGSFKMVKVPILPINLKIIPHLTSHTDDVR